MKKLWPVLVLISLVMIGCNDNNARDNINNNQTVGIENNLNEENENNDASSNLVTEEPVEVAEEIKKVRIAEDVLNVRAQATTDSEILGKVFKDGVYEVVDEVLVTLEDQDKTWYQVDINGHKGWIAGWFCEMTEIDLMDHNPRMAAVDPGIQEYYVKSSQLDLASMIDWDNYKVTYEVTGQVIEPEGILELTLSGQLTIVLKDDLDRERTLQTSIQVYDESKYDKVLYEAMDVNSKIIGFETDVNLTFDEDAEAFISIKDGQLEGWYKAKYKGETCYYHTMDFFHANAFINFQKFHFILEDGSSVTLESVGYIDSRLIEKKVVILEKSYAEHVAVDMVTGDTYDLGAIQLTEDLSYLISYDPFYDAAERKPEAEHWIQVFGFTEQGFERLYWNIEDNLGISDMQIKDHVFTFDVNYDFESPWISTAPTADKASYELIMNGQYYVRQMTKHPAAMTLLKEYGPTHIYYDMDEFSEILTTLKPSDFKSIVDLRTLQVINGQLCTWFQVTLEDDTTGYAFRPRNEWDTNRFFMYEPLKIVLKNGETKTLEGYEQVESSTYINDDLLFMDLLVFNYYYEGVSIVYISLENGEKVDIPISGEIYVSQNHDYLINNEMEYGSEESTLNLYEIHPPSFDQILKMTTVESYFVPIGWVDNAFHFRIVTVTGWDVNGRPTYDNQEAILKQEEGRWIIEGINLEDYDLVLEDIKAE